MADSRGTYVAPSAMAYPSGGNARWWSIEGRDEAAAAMVARGRQIDDAQRWRRDELLIYGSFYSGRQLPSLYQFGSMRARAPLTPWNVGAMGHRAVVSVVQLRSDVFDDAFFRSWRDSYDAAACEAAGGVDGNAEAEIDGRTTNIGTCAAGAHTYHVYLDGPNVIVSVTSVGEGRFGEQIVAGLRE